MKRHIWRLVLLMILVLLMSVGSGCSDGQAVPEKGSGQQQEESTGSMSDETDQEDEGTSDSDSEEDGAEANGSGEGSSTEEGAGSEPVEPAGGSGSNATVEAEKPSVTISVNASTILDNLDSFDVAKREILPKNGMVLESVEVDIKDGDTVFDVLLKVTKEKRVHMEFVSTPLYKSNYIEGIGNIYEIDAGPLSGWMYKVNGIFPNYGCGKYAVQAGDVIEWVYTCDLGRDVGGDWNEQNN